MPWLEDLKFPRGYQMGTHKYKYQTDNDELSYFIVNKVPILIDNTMGKYKQFFYEELSMLAEQTKRYKDLKTYLDSTSDMLPI